jgi:SAM-dependent methyltransferase
MDIVAGSAETVTTFLNDEAPMQSDRKAHWAQVYSTKSPTEVSWYQPTPEVSLSTLDRFGVGPASSLIDVGGGASRFVDELLGRGWRDVTVLDIAASALAASKSRLGPDADRVHWEVADITDWAPSRQWEVWHDRAVFHFLTEPEQRRKYRETVSRALAPDGLLIIATFALDGPEKCSGLTVLRYDAVSLSEELGPSLQLLDGWREVHLTPFQTSQSFTWCVFRHRP